MTATPPAPAMLSVPAVSNQLKIPLDKLRKQLRGNPAAAALFDRIGPLRAISETRLAELKAALAAGGRKDR